MGALLYNFLVSSTEEEHPQVRDSGICQDANFDISKQDIDKYINEEFSDSDFAPYGNYTVFKGNVWDGFSAEVGKLILQVEAFERLNLNTLITEYQGNLPQTLECRDLKINELFHQGYLEHAKQFNKSKTQTIDPLLDDASEKYCTFSTVNHELQQVQRLIVEIRASKRLAQLDVNALQTKLQQFNRELPSLRSRESLLNRQIEEKDIAIDQASTNIESLKQSTSKNLDENYKQDRQLAEKLKEMYNFESKYTQFSQDSLLYDFQDIMQDIKKDFDSSSHHFKNGLLLTKSNTEEQIHKLQEDIALFTEEKRQLRKDLDKIKTDIKSRDLVQIRLDISRLKSIQEQCDFDIRIKEKEETEIKIRYEKAHKDIQSINFKDIPIQKDKHSYSELKALLTKYADLDRLCFQQCHRQASLIEQIEESDIEHRQYQIARTLQEVHRQLNNLQSMI